MDKSTQTVTAAGTAPRVSPTKKFPPQMIPFTVTELRPVYGDDDKTLVGHDVINERTELVPAAKVPEFLEAYADQPDLYNVKRLGIFDRHPGPWRINAIGKTIKQLNILDAQCGWVVDAHTVNKHRDPDALDLEKAAMIRAIPAMFDALMRIAKMPASEHRYDGLKGAAAMQEIAIKAITETQTYVG